MPALVTQSLRSNEPDALNFVALDGTSDSFSYSGGESWLFLQNTSGSPVTVVLLGDQATTVNKPGITVVDVSGGKSVVVPGNNSVKVPLISARDFLTDANNQPDITGGTSAIMAAVVSL